MKIFGKMFAWLAQRIPWQKRVPGVRDAIFLAGTMLFATLVIYQIFGIDLLASAGNFLFIGLSFFLFGLSMLVTRVWRRVLLIAFFVWLVMLGFDIWLRTFLKITYGIPAESPMVLQSLANTQGDEFREGFLHTAPWVFVCIAAAVVWFALAGTLAVQFFNRARRAAKFLPPPTFGLIALTLFCAGTLFAIHFVPAIRTANPIALWLEKFIALTAWREETTTFHEEVSGALNRVPAWNPRYFGAKNQTVVLVIGESTNRYNWSLYGYSRPTTPRLDALEKSGEIVVFRDVLSAAASTVPAVRRMLTIAEARDESRFLEEPNLLQLAHAAGYKVFWLSNQNDTYLHNLFSSCAQVCAFTNDGNADEVTLDDALLPKLDNALADPFPRKFIILHLMGAHPYYDARVPEKFKNCFSFDAENPDEIEQKMLELGRFGWTISARDDYDNAMIFQDFLISECIEKLRKNAAGTRKLLYVSDHAQEVGHTRNFTGHDPNNFVGYAVPMIFWQSVPVPAKIRATIEPRAFQTDMIFWSFLPSILNIETKIAFPQNDVFDLKNFAPREHFFEYTDATIVEPEV